MSVDEAILAAILAVSIVPFVALALVRLAGKRINIRFGRRKDADRDEEKKQTLYCSFCGKSQHDVKKLIAGPTVYICDRCTEECHQTAQKSLPKPSKLEGVPAPREILDTIGSHLSCAEDPKRRLSVATHQHCAREISSLPGGRRLEVGTEKFQLPFGKPHALLVGSSDSAARDLAKSLSEYLDVSLAATDARALAEVSFDRNLADRILSGLPDIDHDRLYRRYPRYGVVFIDNLDGLAMVPGKGSPEHRGRLRRMQQVLIEMMTGTKMVAVSNEALTIVDGVLTPFFLPSPFGYFEVDTRGTIFICAGVFEGLESIVAQRARTGSDDEIAPADNIDDGLIACGLLPELVRRLMVKIVLDPPADKEPLVEG